MSIERKTKAILWGVGFTGVVALIAATTLQGQGDFAAAIRAEVVGLANGESLDKKTYALGSAATSAAAISETLGNMGADFGDTRQATEAACVVAAINGGKTTEGVASYARGVTDNDPAQFALGQRQCENVAAGLMRTNYEFPDAVA